MCLVRSLFSSRLVPVRSSICAVHALAPLSCLLTLRPFPAVLAAMEDASGKLGRLQGERNEMKRREASLKAQLKKARLKQRSFASGNSEHGGSQL